VGEAEQIIRRAFSIARSAAPCVLFFDEIDAILGSEESSHSGGMGRGSHAEARVLSTFLNEMDGIDNFLEDGVLVLGATNRPWTLDAALLRPGRFDKCIYVPPPDLDGRKSILQLQTCNWPTWIDVDRFAQLTENMTGAEIVGACRAACMTGVIHSCSNEPQIRSKDLEEEIKNVKPLLSDPRVLWEYQHFDENRKRQS
jgi:transitional endoplasmic reticulum ATPase